MITAQNAGAEVGAGSGMAAITKWQAGVLNWLDAVSASTRLWCELCLCVCCFMASGNEPCRVWGNEGHVTWHPPVTQ